MIYKFAVCDDEQEYRNLIKVELDRVATACNVKVDVVFFKSAIECLAYFEQGNAPDLLLLDIDMPNMSGLELAKKVREVNEKQLIVFVTAHSEYVFESFEVQPFRFLRKENLYMELYLTLQRAIPMIDKMQPKYLSLKWETGEEMVEVMTVRYAEIWKRRMHFYLEDGRELVVKMTMKKLLEMLRDDDRFVLFDSGLLVNTTQVQIYNRQEVTLKDGTMLPTARTRQEEVKRVIMRNRSRL